MISVYSSYQDGTDGCWLDSIGQVTGWKHTITFPGGDSSASFNFNADTQLTHSALYPGRLIRARADAAVVWTGRLEQPDRGSQPWAMSATGIAALAKDHITLTTPVTLTAFVDDAISHGLPWTRPGTLASPTTAVAKYATLDVDLGELITEGGFWSLDAAGNITTPAAAPTVPTLILHVTDLPARTMQNYANAITVSYLNLSGFPQSLTVTASAGEMQRRGRVESLLDVTSSGAMSISTAQAAGAAQITMDTQPTWTSAFTAGGANSLFSFGGAAVDPATVRPGTVVRVMTLHADDLGTASMDIPIGQVDYDDTAGTAALSALATARDDLKAVLAAPRQL